MKDTKVGNMSMEEFETLKNAISDFEFVDDMQEYALNVSQAFKVHAANCDPDSDYYVLKEDWEQFLKLHTNQKP